MGDNRFTSDFYHLKSRYKYEELTSKCPHFIEDPDNEDEQQVPEFRPYKNDVSVSSRGGIEMVMSLFLLKFI
jgi:hypothetical protein